jgi:hypothetical protein
MKRAQEDSQVVIRLQRRAVRPASARPVPTQVVLDPVQAAEAFPQEPQGLKAAVVAQSPARKVRAPALATEGVVVDRPLATAARVQVSKAPV